MNQYVGAACETTSRWPQFLVSTAGASVWFRYGAQPVAGTVEVLTGEKGWWDRIPEWVKVATTVVGVVAGPVTVVLGARDLFDLKGPGWAKVLAWCAALMVVAAMAGVYTLQYRHHTVLAKVVATHRDELQQLEDRYRRDRGLASAVPSIHDAFHRLRDAGVMIANGDSEFSYRGVMVESLASMASVFTVTVGAPCRLCVKELTVSSDAPADANRQTDPRFLEVTTLWRHDGGSNPVKDAASPLHENSDFQFVLNQVARCFFSNDLDKEINYHNGHRDGPSENFDYNASIVWPIQRSKSDGRIGLLGFLCLDTRETGLFRYDTDFHLGAAYADTLYTAMNLRPTSAPTMAAADQNG